MTSRFILLLLILLAACTSAPASPTATPTIPASPTAKPSSTATPSPLPSPTATRTPRPSATSTRTPSPTPTGVAHEPGPVSVPILLYHRVNNQGSTPYIVRVEAFRAQMKALYEAGYETVTISQVVEVMENGGRLPEKPVVITFDDGYLDVYQNALPIMQEFGFTATAYIITGTIGTDLAYGYMQEAELQALVDAGWEIGSHGITHYNLETTPTGLRTELRDSKRKLEDLLGVEVKSISYPYAVTNNFIKARVKEYEYTSGVGVGVVNTHKPENMYFMSRREVYRSTTLNGFKKLLEPDAVGTGT